MPSQTVPLRARGLIAAVAAALALACATTAHASVDPSTCAHPKGPFTVQGNKVMGYVLNHQLAPVRLTGITTFGLTASHWSSSIGADESQMDAMAAYWCANTVRIQAAPANLFNGSKANQAAYIQAIEGEIQHAFADNLVVVLTAQTENTTGGLGLPTSKTVNYWKTLGRALGKTPQHPAYNNVIFDIFNEPRVGPTGSPTMWKLWHDGGTYKGHTYVGMQTLVNSIRKEGIGRQLWIQGPEHGDTLSGATPPTPTTPAPYAITDPHKPANIVYDIHHPAGAHKDAQWATDFGTLAGSQPVVVGEWTNYSPAKPSPECWADAPTAVPAFLDYVNHLQLGLIAWTLQPGVLISSTALNAPTAIGAGWSCSTFVDQGAGTDLMGFFAQANAKSQY